MVLILGLFPIKRILCIFSLSMVLILGLFSNTKGIFSLSLKLSLVVLILGLFSNIKGILCIGFLKRARQQKEITREQAEKDLEVSDHAENQTQCLVLSRKGFYFAFD